MDNQNLHEINRYSDTAFPVQMYTTTREAIFPEGRGYMDLHWHEELQITFVISGILTMEVNGASYTINAGEAIFINRNLLHMSKEMTYDGKYVSFNFPERILGFFSGSRMEQNMVRPYTNNAAFPVVIFKNSVPWQRKILAMLWDLQHIYEDGRQADSVYSISIMLVQIWHEFIDNVAPLVVAPTRGYVKKQERIQTLLDFIHTHYMEDISLEDIAMAANVSVGECSRCFKDMVNTSPKKYLLKYRIARSIELLDGTELSVSDVAFACGFNDSSHFTQYFKQETGMTPRDYRNRRW